MEILNRKIRRANIKNYFKEKLTLKWYKWTFGQSSADELPRKEKIERMLLNTNRITISVT
jgi:hypothetical protein